jgi:hypothetical protein
MQETSKETPAADKGKTRFRALRDDGIQLHSAIPGSRAIAMISTNVWYSSLQSTPCTFPRIQMSWKNAGRGIEDDEE